MKKKILFFLVKLGLSLLIAVGAPILVAVMLQTDGSLLWIIVVITALNILFLWRNQLKGRLQTLISISILVIYILSSLFIMLYIVVIPFPAYLAWLELVRSARAGGIISFLFFVGTAYFSSLMGGLVYSCGIMRPLGGLLIVLLFELVVVYQNLLSGVLFTAAVILSVVMLAILPHKLKLQNLVSPISLLFLVVVLSALLSMESKPNSGYLSGRTLDPAIKRLLIEIFPDLPLLIEVSGYGYSYENENLGSKPILSNTPIFLIEGTPGESIYLRTQVYDEYSQSGWFSSFGLNNKTEGENTLPFSQQIKDTHKIKLTLLFDYFDLLPHTLGADSIVLESKNPPEVAFGSMDTGFIFKFPLLKGDVVIINRQEKEREEGKNLSEIRALLSKIAGRTVEYQSAYSPEYREEIFKYYLKVPDFVPDNIRDLARRLGSGATKSWEILVNIYKYLAKNYVYTLNTNPPPAGEDFLTNFLFTTKKGYCVHFTTAFIILARLNGIPARYTSGFFVYLPQSEPTSLITGLQSHAWPEVWFPELGWTTFEATPSIDLAAFYNSEYYRLFNPENDPLTARQLEALMGKRIPVPVREEINVLQYILPFLSFAFGASLFVVLIIGGLRYIKKHRRKKSPYKGNLKRLEYHLSKIVRKLNKRSIPFPETTGWMEWGERVKKAFPDKAGYLATFLEIINKAFYNSYPPSKDDLRFLIVLRKRLTGKPGPA
jgi:hypothetical protein